MVSWLLLRGRCAQCDTPISARYPFVELLTGTLTGLAAWQFGFGPEALSAFILIWILIALTGIDIDTQLLPDSMTLALLWIGLAVNLFDTWTSLPSAVMGAMLRIRLWSVYWVFKLVTGKRGWATGISGCWRTGCLVRLADRSCDYPAVVFCGRITGISILLKGVCNRTPMPFGPYLAGAGLVILFFGKTLMTEYLQRVAL